MNNVEKQIYFQAHMLNECFVNESIFDGKKYDSIDELKLFLDLYPTHKKEIIQKAGKKFKLNGQDAFFVVAEDGNCALFNNRREIDDLSKVKEITENMIRKDITSINIPDSVKNIGDGAFYWCEYLESINIPDSVKIIKYRAFDSCISLKSISIPSSVKSVENWAFNNCKSLTSINIPDSVVSIGYGAFYDCASLTSINISDSVESIGNEAFRQCESLKSVVIPDLVEYIGYKAFYDCASLESINIPSSVKSIGDWAFTDCTSLISIIIPDSVESIGSYAFCDCKSLEEVVFKNKTLEEIKWMDNYPWGIEDESIIKCQESLNEKKKFRQMKKDFKKHGQSVFPEIKSDNDIVFVSNIPKDKALYLLRRACHNVSNFHPDYMEKGIKWSDDQIFGLFNRHDKRNVLAMASVSYNGDESGAAYLHEMTGFIKGGYGQKLVKLLMDKFKKIYGQIALNGSGTKGDPYRPNEKLRDKFYAKIPGMKLYRVENSCWDCPADFFYYGISDESIKEFLEKTYGSKEHNAVHEGENLCQTLYRFCIGSVGVYEAAKDLIFSTFDADEAKKKWSEVLAASSWLPKPNFQYSKEYESWFTLVGKNLFEKTVLCVLRRLGIDNIELCESVVDNNRIVYSDIYQVIVKSDKLNENEIKMKKKYTKKQITEAIAYWKKQLKKIDESTLNTELIDVSASVPGTGFEFKPNSITLVGEQNAKDGTAEHFIISLPRKGNHLQ